MIKKLIQNYKLQFVLACIFTTLFMIRSYFKTVGMMTVSNAYVFWISILTILIGTVLLLVVSYAMLRRETKLEQIYPVVGMALGMMFILVIPVMATPDDTYHFSGSYHLSNKIMGIGYPEGEGDIYVRKCDSGYANTSFAAGLYNDFNETFQQDVDTSLVECQDISKGDASFGSYIIPALGITLGRLLHLNFPLMSMLGAFFNLSWFVLWMTYALKKIPVGKRILFTILVLPMTLQQVSSYSRDNPLLASAILIVALTLHWKYSEEKIKISEIIVYLYASYVLITVKSALYAFLVLFVFFVMVNKKWFRGPRKWIAVAGIGLVCVLGLVVALPLHGWDRVYSIFITEYYQAPTGTYGNSAWYYMTHLGDLIQRLGYTFGEYGDDYILQLTGNGLGWLEIPNSLKARVIYITMALLAVVRTKEDTMKLGAQTRVFSVLFGFGGIFLCLFAMLLFWTPANHMVIEGIQGRYFLPLLLPIFIGLGYWKKPVIRLEVYRYYPIVLSGVGYIMALSVIRYNL